MNDTKPTRVPAVSFIVRVWKDEESSPHMRGEIEHVGTGEKRLFLDHWSLVKYIETWRQDARVA